MSKNLKKKYGYFIGIVNKKDIFQLQSIILKSKKKTIYIILIIMTYDFSWAIVQVTKLIACTFSQCMPNFYCTTMTIIHIYSEIFNFVLWLTIVTHYLCVPRFTVYILIQLYIFRMIINTLVHCTFKDFHIILYSEILIDVKDVLVEMNYFLVE